MFRAIKEELNSAVFASPSRGFAHRAAGSAGLSADSEQTRSRPGLRSAGCGVLILAPKNSLGRAAETRHTRISPAESGALRIKPPFS